MADSGWSVAMIIKLTVLQQPFLPLPFEGKIEINVNGKLYISSLLWKKYMID